MPPCLIRYQPSLEGITPLTKNLTCGVLYLKIISTLIKQNFDCFDSNFKLLGLP